MQVQKYVCTDFPSLADAIVHYLAEHAISDCSAACLAVAAAIDSDNIQLTNSDWEFSASKLTEQFRWQRLEMINDFEAIAHAIPRLGSSGKTQIGGASAEPQGNIAVLGPGTGLGVKHITAMDGAWKVLQGEGGHVDFAPLNEQDLNLWRFIRQGHDRVSMENILSGRGLVNIYQALVQDADAKPQFQSPEAILQAGLTDSCHLCAQSLQQFLRILGSFAGNLALNLNTTGGVYLCGGVLSPLADVITASGFRENFEAKGRFRGYVESIPVFLITAKEPGLIGAAAYLDSV